MNRFDGKVVLVTGGAKGAGRAVCREFARLGAQVVVNYFQSAQAAAQTVADIRKDGGSAEPLRASVARAGDVQDMFTQVARRHEGLDVLVNNAASSRFAPLSALTEQDWVRTFETNLHGARRCARAAAPLIAARGGGAIVNVSSIGAGHVFGNYCDVGTSMAALEALTRYLAVEYAASGIRVNTASSELIDSQTRRLSPEADALRETIVRATPLGRLATEKDLADLIVFLSSPRSSYITGQVILADGGLTLASTILSPPAAAARKHGRDGAPASAERPRAETVQADAWRSRESA
jgi:NAD(P)-dependent dehydrogenase (short-subunit alcohol dehydrogenase family)